MHTLFILAVIQKLELLVDDLCLFERTLLEQCIDLGVRIKQGTDGSVVVQSGDEASDVLRNVDFMEPRAVLQFRVKVRQVAAEDAVDEALFIRFIELCEAVREDGIRAVSEEAAPSIRCQRLTPLFAPEKAHSRGC